MEDELQCIDPPAEDARALQPRVDRGSHTARDPASHSSFAAARGGLTDPKPGRPTPAACGTAHGDVRRGDGTHARAGGRRERRSLTTTELRSDGRVDAVLELAVVFGLVVMTA